MRKYTIIGVIVLMSISLLGVVGLQLYWINNAIKVKQELFERNVHDALAKVVEKLEMREAVSVVANQMASLNDSNSISTVEMFVTRDSVVTTTTLNAKNKVVTPNVTTNKTTTLPSALAKSKAVKEVTTASQALVPLIPSKLGPRLSNFKIGSVDTIYYNDAKRMLNFAKGFYQQTDTTPGRKQYKRVIYGEADTANFKQQIKGQPYRSERILDANIISSIPNHKIFKLSADTLSLLAVSLDSLMPDVVSSIQVRDDSVFIYRTGAIKPTYVYKPTKNDKYNNIKIETGTSIRGLEVFPMRESTPLKMIRNVMPSQAQLAQATSLKATEAKTIKPTPADLKAEAIQKIEGKKEKLNVVVQKMMDEYVVRDIPLKERLNVRNFQALLSDELREKGIDMEYGYHVVSANQDTVAIKRAGQTAKAEEDTKYFATFLFPNDIIEKPDYLAVYFPDTQTYAIRSLAGMMGLSGLFTLIIIATFATTIHIIYKQKRLSEMKNDFINNMTHEFKTPIATISLATDSIFNPKVYESPDRIKYYTSIIKAENKRMNAQVENVLQIALLEKNEFRLNLQPIDVHVLIHKATESIRLQVEQRLGQISIDLKAMQHELQSDEMHLFNVICNLLDNANKYSPKVPDIELSTQDVEGGLLIAVDDKGMGMSKETQKRIFEKFYRVPTGNLHNVKGFGLGLSYVKAIVEAHHGTIKLWSEPGQGSRFEIFLPYNK